MSRLRVKRVPKTSVDINQTQTKCKSFQFELYTTDFGLATSFESYLVIHAKYLVTTPHRSFALRNVPLLAFVVLYFLYLSLEEVVVTVVESIRQSFHLAVGEETIPRMCTLPTGTCLEHHEHGIEPMDQGCDGGVRYVASSSIVSARV